MSAKQPEIKFSPFEALLIGENNRVLKRQPMKNTIFVTRPNQKNNTINLRALFGLDKYTTNSRSSDDIFKTPQSVHEFLNIKKYSYENNGVTGNKEDVCNEFKGHKMFVKNNNSVKSKYKKSKTKSKKVKFKEKFNRYGNKKIVDKVQDALKNHSGIKKCNLTDRNGEMPKVGLKECPEGACCVNRYRLRSKRCKFTCETDYESLQSEQVNTKINQDHLSNSMCELLMINNKNIFNDDNQIQIEDSKEFKMPNLIGMSEWDKEFDLSTPDIFLNELCKHNCCCLGDFEFPKCPRIEVSDFDNDENLVDIIYEDFPKSFTFESKDSSPDFNDALINADIIKPVKEPVINVTKEVLEQDQKVKVSCGTQTSYMDIPRPIDLSSCYRLEPLTNGYIATADGFVAIQNHLITDQNFGNLFISSPNGHNTNDLVMARFMKPLIRNTWVRSL